MDKQYYNVIDLMLELANYSKFQNVLISDGDLKIIMDKVKYNGT